MSSPQRDRDPHAVYPDFPHDVNEEPTGDWTVQELMQWHVLRAHRELEDALEERTQLLTQQLEEYTEVLLKLQEKLDGQQEKQPEAEEVEMAKVHMENVDPSAKPNPTNASSKVCDSNVVKAFPKATNTLSKVLVSVTSGKHEGQSFELFPTEGDCLLGRSKGKKFRVDGVSLPEDSEVSTTHGKFQYMNFKFYFTDTGSTNGTLHKDTELRPGNPLELADGMVLQVGQTQIRINLE